MPYVKNHCEEIYQEYLKEYQQVYSQAYQQENQQRILNKLNTIINIYESRLLIQPDEIHNNPNICRVDEAIRED